MGNWFGILALPLSNCSLGQGTSSFWASVSSSIQLRVVRIKFRNQWKVFGTVPPVPNKCYQYCFGGLLCIKLGHDRVKFVPGTASAQTSRWEGGCYVQGISPMASCHAPPLLTFQFLYVPWSVLLQGLCTSCALCPQGPSSINLLADCPLSSHPKYYHCRKLPLPTLAHGVPFSPLLCCPIPLVCT